MKKSKLFAVTTLFISIVLGFGSLLGYHPEEAKTDEVNFNGAKAMPFENRYDSDLSGEPNGSTFYKYNYKYMGTGGNSVETSTVWDNYRGETNSGEPVVVAVIDSGIDIFHEDFLIPEAKGVKLNFSNVANYSTLSPKSCYIYDTGDGYTTDTVVTKVGITNAYDTDLYEDGEYYSHGTAVSSCIASSVNGVGGFGLAPNVQIMFIKMDFYFTSLDVAIRYAADNGAKVINLSLCAYAETFYDGYGYLQKGYSYVATDLEPAIQYANSKDVVIVAAAGNEKTNKKSYPACNTGVVGVGALASQSGTTAADFSNFNSGSDSSTSKNNVDVMAPGYVYTAQVPQNPARSQSSSAAVADDTYSSTSGTSFASPLAAAAIALYRGAHPGDNREKVISELKGSCYDMGTSGWDSKYGFGRIDVEEFINVGIPVETVTVSPSSKSLTITNENPSPTVQLSASFLPANADETYKVGEWLAMDESVATVDDNGLVTAIGGGTTEVYFVTNKDMIDGMCTITVTDTIIRPVTGIKLNPSTASVGLNKTVTLTPVFSPINATNKNVTWSSSDTSIATVNAGVVTGLKVGSTTITVTTQDGGFTATCIVTVNNIIKNSFTIDRSSHNTDQSYGWQPWTSNSISGYSYIYGGTNDKMQFNNSKTSYYMYNSSEVPGDITAITIYLNSSTSADRTSWSIRTSNTSFGQVSGTPATGTLYEAKNISESGTKFEINGGSYFAICYESNGASYLDSVVVEYNSYGSSEPVIQDEVSLDQTSLTLEVGDTTTLQATANGAVTWTSSNPTCASVSSNGLVTALAEGDAVVTATCGKAIATCQVTVNAKTVEPEPEEPETPSGLEGYVLVTDVSTLKAGDKVVIASSNYDKALGKTQNNNNRSAVKVTKTDDLLEITSNVDELVLGTGTTASTYSFYSETNSGYLFAASSSNNYLRTENTLTANSSFTITISNEVATIKASGSNSRNLIKYNNSSTIFSCYNSGQEAVSLYKYYEASQEAITPSSITINPSSLNLDLSSNKTATLSAEVGPIGANQSVTWTSSLASVATVSNTGVVTAISKGTTTITAKSVEVPSLTATCTVTVSDSTPTLLGITVSNIPETVPYKGSLDTSGIIVTANYENGEPKVVNNATFSSIDTSSIGNKIVTVSYQEGNVTKNTTFTVFCTNKGATRTENTSSGLSYSSGDFGTTNGNRFTSNNQTININSKGYNWTINASFSASEYFNFDGTKGSQLGSGKNPITSANISSTGFKGTINKVTVNASYASGGSGSIEVRVGGVSFTPSSTSLSTSATNYEFSGSGSGKIEIIYKNNASKAMYFKSVSVTTVGSVSYSWTGDEQATSFVSYLKTFGSCASSWSDRDAIVTLVNEFNYMIQDGKDSSVLSQSFTDNGYQTSALDKLKMIVSEYNKTLEEGEETLTLVLSVDAYGNPLIVFDGLKTTIQLLDIKFVPILLIILILGFASFVLIKTRRKEN